MRSPIAPNPCFLFNQSEITQLHQQSLKSCEQKRRHQFTRCNLRTLFTLSVVTHGTCHLCPKFNQSEKMKLPTRLCDLFSSVNGHEVTQLHLQSCTLWLKVNSPPLHLCALPSVYSKWSHLIASAVIVPMNRSDVISNVTCVKSFTFHHSVLSPIAPAIFVLCLFKVKSLSCTCDLSTLLNQSEVTLL